jgi:serine phosphatase RsbU (regulator of sigma subunit)
VKGKIDLRKYNFDQYSTVEVDLIGEWEFYWKELLTPKDFKQNSFKPILVEVPSKWSSYQKDGQNLPVEGYATYRLEILVNDSPFDSLGLEIPRIWTVSKVWVNNQIVHEQGKVSDTASNFENNMVGLIIPIKAVNHKIEIVVQVANFNFFLGGIIENFKFSTHENIHISNELKSSWGIMWIGILAIMAIYHLILFFFRQDSRSTLWFSFICILIGLRYINFGHHYFYEYLHLHASWYSPAIQVKTYYITQLLLAPVGLLYVHSLYPKRLIVKVLGISLVRISVIITLIYCLFALVVAVPIFINTMAPYQVIYFSFIAYLVSGIVWATIKKEEETYFQIAGILTMILAGINDVLHILGVHFLGDVEILPVAFGVFLLLQVFAIARRFSRSFKETKELARTLEEKVKVRTADLENKNEEIQAQSLAVNEANGLLAKKNKDITDSVRYASRIQKAILADLDVVTTEFNDAFVFFKPKDILSGDFYWYFKCKDSGAQIIIAADCTGHGVPGAFMTVMANDFLNEIITDRGIMKPSQIIEELDKKVRSTLQENKTDGLDIAILLVDGKQENITYAGARNPLYYVRNNELNQIKATRRSIGGNLKLAQKVKNITFENHSLKIEKGDAFYIFSDGFQDQFGGKNDTKYMTKNFRQLLFQNHTLKMEEQKKKLKNELEHWQGNKSQTDDILVIGLRF